MRVNINTPKARDKIAFEMVTDVNWNFLPRNLLNPNIPKNDTNPNRSMGITINGRYTKYSKTKNANIDKSIHLII